MNYANTSANIQALETGKRCCCGWQKNLWRRIYPCPIASLWTWFYHKCNMELDTLFKKNGTNIVNNSWRRKNPHHFCYFIVIFCVEVKLQILSDKFVEWDWTLNISCVAGGDVMHNGEHTAVVPGSGKHTFIICCLALEYLKLCHLIFIWKDFVFLRLLTRSYKKYQLRVLYLWKKYTSGPRYWNVPVLVNTGTFLVYQYYPKIWYLRSLEHAGDIHKQTILEHQYGLVLSNTRVPVSGTWSLLFPYLFMQSWCSDDFQSLKHVKRSGP